MAKTPKYGINIMPTNNGNRVIVETKVTKDDRVLGNVTVQLFLDGEALSGQHAVTDRDGIARFEFPAPKEAKSYEIKAIASVNGTTTGTAQFAIGSESSKKDDSGNRPIFVVEDHRQQDSESGVTTYRLSMGLFDSKGKMIPGGLQGSSNAAMNVTYPRFSATPAPGATNRTAPVSDIENVRRFDTTLNKQSWKMVDVSFDSRRIRNLELDLYVKGWNLHLELDLEGEEAPHTVSVGRQVFASIMILLLMCSVIPTLFWWLFDVIHPVSWVVAFMVASAIAVGVHFGARYLNEQNNPETRIAIDRSPGQSFLQSVVDLCMGTNNSWFVAMFFLTILAWLLILGAPAGDALLSGDHRDNTTIMTPEVRQGEYRVGDRAQEIRNYSRRIGSYRDRDLVKPKPPVSWTLWWNNVIIAVLFILGTFFYSFKAFSDEAVKAFKSARRLIVGSGSEGSVGESLGSRLFGGLFGGSRSSSGGGSSGGGSGGFFSRIFGWFSNSFAGYIGWNFIENVIQSVFKGRGDSRHHHSTGE